MQSLLVCFLLAGSLFHAGPAGAQVGEDRTSDAPVQIFRSVDRTTLAVGEAFVYEVEVYASPVSFEDAVHLAGAVAGGRFVSQPSGLEIVRREAVTRMGGVQAGDPLEVHQRIVLRARQPGTLVVPAFVLEHGGRTVRAPEQEVTAYEVAPGFFDSREAIFPVVAERESGVRRDRLVRVGSAFLVAPDAVATSLHVILDARRVWLTLPSGKRLQTKRVWAVDPSLDVAILAVDAKTIAREGLTPLELAPPPGSVVPDPGGMERDEVVFTYGWPGGVQRSTAGVRYRGVPLQPLERLTVSTNPVRPGDSGGPLLDRFGRVLGVISAGTVNGDQPDVLREEVSMAFDIRTALGQARARWSSRSLRALKHDPAFRDHPYVVATRLTNALTTGIGADAFSLADAMSDLQAAAVRRPFDARLHFMQGIIYQMLGTGAPAAASYRATLRANEGHFMASYMLGQYHLRRREYGLAERYFRKTQAYAPYAHFAAFGLAQTLIEQLRYEEAIPLLQNVLALDPNYAPALFHLALCRIAQGEVNGARQLLVKLRGVSRIRARELERVLAHEALRPVVLLERPRSKLRQ